jgi:hypothetical protein
VFLYTGADRTGAPAEMRPGAGDTFTLQETWLDLDEGDRVVREAVEPGPTLTFGAQPWSWKTLDAAAGSYWIGYSVEDLDGRSTSAVAPIEVR